MMEAHPVIALVCIAVGVALVSYRLIIWAETRQMRKRTERRLGNV